VCNLFVHLPLVATRQCRANHSKPGETRSEKHLIAAAKAGFNVALGLSFGLCRVISAGSRSYGANSKSVAAASSRDGELRQNQISSLTNQETGHACSVYLAGRLFVNKKSGDSHGRYAQRAV
jgi:hypothetical protein